MSRYVLAIDQGTGGTKTVLFDESGAIVTKAFVHLHSIYPQVGFVEQDPEEIYQNVLASVKACLSFEPTLSKRIAAVGISNQRETFLLWDDDGKPLCNAVVWQCKRSTEICERLQRTSVEKEVQARTGLTIDPYFSGSKLTWLIENQTSIASAVQSGSARFGTVDAWLLFRLTNGASYYTDHTNASRTLLYNIHTLDWDETLIEAFGAKGIRMPQAKPSCSAFGESDFEGLFSKPVPITGMIGDSHAAAFGQQCFAPGQAKATLGTGSSILCNVGNAPRISDQGMVGTICWSTPDRTDYALEGVIVTCGATVKWLRDQLELFDNSKDTETMATSVEDNGGVYLIPAFSGLGAPHWKMDATASIVGLTFGSNRNHVARAALESVAFQIKDVITAMEKDSGEPLSRLRLDGGMTSNRFLMHLVADLLGVPVVTMGMEEVSALGAAYMAGLEVGVYESIDSLAALNGDETVYEPQENAYIHQAHATWQSMIAKHC